MKQRESYLEAWTLYRWCFIGHHIQGAIVACLILTNYVPWMVTGCVWVFLYACYQGFSVIRKRDSAGLDISDFMAGYAIGVAVYYVARLFV